MECDEFVWPSEMFVGERSACSRSNGQPDCVPVHESHPNLPILSHHQEEDPGPTRSIRWVAVCEQGFQQLTRCLSVPVCMH